MGAKCCSAKEGARKEGAFEAPGETPAQVDTSEDIKPSQSKPLWLIEHEEALARAKEKAEQPPPEQDKPEEHPTEQAAGPTSPPPLPPPAEAVHKKSKPSAKKKPVRKPVEPEEKDTTKEPSMEPPKEPETKANVTAKSSSKPKGTIFYTLRIKIVGAKGLRNADVGVGLSDPYCVCQVADKPALKFHTKAIDDRLDPVWNYTVELSGIAVSDVLEFSVWDKDTFTPDDLLGTCSLAKADFLPAGCRKSVPLSNTSTTAMSQDSTLQVLIDVLNSVIVSPGKTPQMNVKVVESGDDEPEVTVNIIGAKNLRNADHMPGQGLSDPYCVCEVPDKPKSRIRTPVAKDTLNPVWNYSAKVPGYSTGDSLQFSVMDKDIGKSDDLLGQVTLASEKIGPNGWIGELHLHEDGHTKGKAAAVLNLKVSLQYPDDGTIVPQVPAAEVSNPSAAKAPAASSPASEGTAAHLRQAAKLLQAAQSGDSKQVKRLLEAGAPPEATNGVGMTALHVGAESGHEDVVGMLLLQKSKKKLVAAKTVQTKETALHIAARLDHRNIAVMLVREGASLKAKDAKGKTPPDLAKDDLASWMRGADPAGTNPPWMK